MATADTSCLGNLCLHGCLPASPPTVTSVVTGGNYSSLLSISPGADCMVDLPPLTQYSYNCTLFTCSTYDTSTNSLACDLTVPTDQISNSTWTSACQAEWWWHANFLGSMAVVLMYILCNISRVYFVRGVARLGWRYLTDGRFSYLGTCDRAGELKFPNVVTIDGWSMKRAIRESLALRIQRFERRSLFLTAFAISLNIPYIIVLVVLNQTMRPIGLGSAAS